MSKKTQTRKVLAKTRRPTRSTPLEQEPRNRKPRSRSTSVITARTRKKTFNQLPLLTVCNQIIGTRFVINSINANGSSVILSTQCIPVPIAHDRIFRCSNQDSYLVRSGKASYN